MFTILLLLKYSLLELTTSTNVSPSNISITRPTKLGLISTTGSLYSSTI